jgi:DNA (cytosine-5)-methyltransferase 1
MIKLLDLFCGAGGTAMGYHRASFEVVGVDIAKQPRFPFEFHQADALTYLAEHWQEFDVIHASPPCQGYSVETPMAYRQNHPRTITKVRQALIVTGKPFVIENVPNAKSDMVNPVTLCGSMFGLRVWRHRCFEIVPELFFLLPPCDHSFVPVLVTGTPRRKGYPRVDPPVTLRREAMGIDWKMPVSGLDQAIPPAYTEYIGKLLAAHLQLRAGHRPGDHCRLAR